MEVVRAALAVLVFAACSRASACHPAGSSARPSLAAPRGGEAGITAAYETPAPAGDDHALALDPEIVGDDPPPAMDLAPGEAPSAAFPAGTVYVARYEDAGVEITEWDLAAKRPRRAVKLPLPDTYSNVRLLRVGHALHAAAWAFEADLAYLRLTDDLRVVTSQRLGTVSSSGPVGLAGDDELAVVAGAGAFGPAGSSARGIYAASFDGAGQPIASRLLEAGARPEVALGLRDGVAVIGGRAFVLVRTPRASALEVLRLDPALEIERRTALRAPEVYAQGTRTPALDAIEVAIFARDGRLVVDAPGAPSVVELLFGAAETRRWPKSPGAPSCSTTAREVGHDVWLGPEHVILAYGARKGNAVEVALRWADEGGAGAWTPPCPGAPEWNADATDAARDR